MFFLCLPTRCLRGRTSFHPSIIQPQQGWNTYPLDMSSTALCLPQTAHATSCIAQKAWSMMTGSCMGMLLSVAIAVTPFREYACHDDDYHHDDDDCDHYSNLSQPQYVSCHDSISLKTQRLWQVGHSTILPAHFFLLKTHGTLHLCISGLEISPTTLYFT